MIAVFSPGSSASGKPAEALFLLLAALAEAGAIWLELFWVASVLAPSILLAGVDAAAAVAVEAETGVPDPEDADTGVAARE